MCKDYKEYDIDLDDNKCLKIDCPYLYRDWFDYEYELQDGTSVWDYHEACICDIKNQRIILDVHYLDSQKMTILR